MGRDVFCKGLAFLIRVEGMKTASVKRDAEGRAGNFAGQKVQHHKGALNLGLQSFLYGLLDGGLGNIDTCHLEIILSQPDGVIAGAAPDIQGPAGFQAHLGHGLNKVAIRLADIPGGIA
jgi:hypothetical protein